MHVRDAQALTLIETLGRGLRSQYDELLAQPMPHRLAMLLQQLQELKKPTTSADERVSAGALPVIEGLITPKCMTADEAQLAAGASCSAVPLTTR